MVAALFEDKNFNKRAIKKQQLEKWFADQTQLMCYFQKIKNFCQLTLILGVNYQAH